MSKILIDHTVLEQALEDMEMTINYVQSPTRREDMRDSIEALRAALEQEKSPQNASSASQAFCEVPQVTDQTEHFLVLADEEVYCTKHPQVEQEPVAWTKPNWQSDPWATAVMDEQKKRDVARNDGTPISKFSAAHTIPLYTHPQPKREPLTDEQITELADAHMEAFAQFVGAGEVWFEGEKEFARAIERAHGITGEQE